MGGLLTGRLDACPGSPMRHAPPFGNRAGKKRAELQKVGALVFQLDDLLKQMEIEVRGSRDAGVKSKVQSYKKTLGSLREDYRRAVEQEERSGLLGGRDSGVSLARRSVVRNERRNPSICI